MNTHAKGIYGERKAFWYLVLHGYIIKERNYHCDIGEIDIIAKKGGTYHFIEVKYRSTDKYGLPSEAVDKRKQHKIIRVAELYILIHNLQDYAISFDVVEILGKKINFLIGAFQR